MVVTVANDAPSTVSRVPKRRDLSDPELLRRVVTEKAKHLLAQDAALAQRVEFERAAWDAYRQGASAPGISRALQQGLLDLGFTEAELYRAGISPDNVRTIVEGPRP